MIEYGLSVSLDGTPRTPHAYSPVNDAYGGCGGDGGAPRKMMKFGDFIDDDGESGEGDNGDGDNGDGGHDSISPRVLFPDDVSRRLDFSSMLFNNHESSPVSFASVSIPRNGAAGVEGGGPGGVETNEPESVGDCNVCYKPLQKKANHVFTMCGHLFCIYCFLRWWDTSSTCPMCRAELFDPNANADDNAVAVAVADAIEDAVADAVADAIEGRDAWMRPPPDYEIERMQIQAQANLDERVYIDSSDSDSDRESDRESDTGDSIDLHIRNTTLINRYRFQDSEWRWSFHRASIETSPNYDDTVYPLSQADIDGLRENRQIATTLFARMRFRETMFQPDVQFLGEVWSGSWIPKSEWIDIMRHHQPVSDSESDDAIQTRMYEFVIRRGSNISPYHEVNIFGFIKDVRIQQTVEYDEHTGEEISRDRMDYDWENIVEYTFDAEVFTPTDFYVHGGYDDPNQYRSYGGYNMTDGTITTQQVMIPFSQIRRMYRMNGNERRSA
jgi:hypothetical protein